MSASSSETKRVLILAYAFIWVFLFAAVWVDRGTVVFIEDPALRHTLRSIVAGMAIPFSWFKLQEDPKIGTLWFMGLTGIFLYVLFFT